MDSQLRSQVVFHLTGRRAATEATEPPVAGLRPALLASYRHLESLRYDFPVILKSGVGADGEYAQSLSGIVDGVLRQIAPQGVPGEGIRRRVLKVEREIRRRAATGARESLRQLWDDATGALTAHGDDAFVRDVRRARDALGVDGEVADCDDAWPARFVRHAWSAVQRDKAAAACERIGRLVIRLEDVLRADYLRSPEALKAPALQSSFGAVHRELFDFNAMSRLLSRAEPHGGLGDRRRARVERALAALKAQRFFASAAAGSESSAGDGAHEFAFDGADAALEAFRCRTPEMVQLLKALHVADLEVEGAYVEGMHDAIVDAIDERAISAADLEFFPDYLVCLTADGARSGAATRLTESLSSGVPLKVVVQVSDLLEEAAIGQGHFAFGMRSAQLASAAMSLDDVFVLQSTASNLLQMRDRIRRGLRQPGPALFSIYAASSTAGGEVPGYLVAAAAMQSRAFPAFSYDPGAGPDFASRFSLENNPQLERDWPVEWLSYADQDLQSVTEEVAFTFIDYVACDPRCAQHFSPVPRSSWTEGMLPVQQWLASPAPDASSGVPYVLAVDDRDLLCRLVVDERLIRAAQRCREGWHRLQELAGIHDSRAERLLARERQAWEAEHRQAQEQAVALAPPPAVESVAARAVAAPAAVEAEPARNPDEAYIETIRCSTCNECTQANPRMFAYNENKQACIVDLKAGTYRQLVEAAESCQVSVIHPGKPWDANEPGLEELLERARPFL